MDDLVISRSKHKPRPMLSEYKKQFIRYLKYKTKAQTDIIAKDAIMKIVKELELNNG